MAEISINEYVRTPEQGFIGKLVEIIPNVLNYYKIDVGREIIHCDNSRDNYIYSRDGFGLKHSKNIIDLIEVGDYVNGYYVIDDAKKDKKYITIAVNYREYGEEYLKNKEIESVVTKEQFKSIEYRWES